MFLIKIWFHNHLLNRLINAAYELLGNPLKRSGYDQMLEALERKRRNQRLDSNTYSRG